MIMRRICPEISETLNLTASVSGVHSRSSPARDPYPRIRRKANKEKTASGFDTMYSRAATIPHGGVRTLSRTGPV